MTTCRSWLLNIARYQTLAQWLTWSDGLLIAAGAGMGVDSGLPDFRGTEGFWKAYPKAAEQGLSFAQLANPLWFRRDPAQAWGFYGHRYQLYSSTQPHRGFSILLNWAASRPLGGFVFTSNVDGHFQKAGFDDNQVYECHGSIHYWQCSQPCCDAIWPAPGFNLNIDAQALRCFGALPQCPHCAAVARPNILMFGDGNWLSRRSDVQWQRYQSWLNTLRGRNLLIIELGAGESVATVRYESESLTGRLVRINPRDSHGPAGTLSIDEGALSALLAVEELMV